MNYSLQNALRFGQIVVDSPKEATGLLMRTARSRFGKAGERVLARSGLGQKIFAPYKGRGLVLMFHEIHKNVEAGLRMGCSPDQLRRVLKAVKKGGRDFVTVDEAMRRLDDPKAADFAIVTFDDGYRDNRDLALPILEEFQAPLVLFAPTGMITRDIYAWWLGLRQLLCENETVDIAAMAQSFKCHDASNRNAALRQILLWIDTDQTRANALAPTFSKYAISIPNAVDRVAFSEAELVDYARHPLVTIGGHTTTHRFLAGLDEDEASRDIAENRLFLQDLTGQPVLDFAYPYGSPGACGMRETKLVSQAGFRSAFTTRPGNLFSEHLHSPHLLPREDMGGGFLSDAEMTGRIEGWRRALVSRQAGPVAKLL